MVNKIVNKLNILKSLSLSNKVKERLVVFESDDWGSTRMPNRDIFEKALKSGYPVDKSVYTQYDCLESYEDLDRLFDLLSSFKDSFGNNPIFTANFIVANPDYNKIVDDKFENYHLETIDNLYKRVESKIFSKIALGNENKLFFPQFHGREHVNVERLMHELKSGNKDIRFAVLHGMPGIFKKNTKLAENNFVVELEHKDYLDLRKKKENLDDGLKKFKNIFGYKSESAIACNYVWHPEIERILFDNNVKYIQGSIYQLIPRGNYIGFEKKLHYTGETNCFNQTYLVRNCHFEPSSSDNDILDGVLKQIKIAFMFNNPAIISTHRINYVSGMSSKNRDKGLRNLKFLINKILQVWPDVKFLSSVDLGKIVNNF